MKKIVLILTSIVCISCSMDKQEKQDEIVQGNFAHTVFFWLENPYSSDDRAAFETSLKRFIQNSVFIKTKHIGVPAATSRGVIDNTYTYSLLLTFANKAAQDNYQEEALHKQFIKESEHLWKKVVVYDSENLLN